MKFSKSAANKKAISFYSHHLNKEKLNTITEFAKKIQILQNFISYIYFDEYFNNQTIKFKSLTYIQINQMLAITI